ncbi:MAG: TolC family outer membrane protein [Pseudomonadota bacterium]
MSRPLPLSLLSALLLTLLPGLAPAAKLGDVYLLARESDAKLAAAREAQKASQEKIPQGRAGLLPSLSLDAFLRRTESRTSTTSNDYTSHGYSLALVQPLYRRQNLEAYEQAKLQSLLGDQQFKVAEQDLLLRVATAYFDVLLAQDALATAQAQKKAFAEQLAQARKSFEVGAATITDTHEAQARFDLTTAQEIAALNDLEVKRRALEKIIDREAPALATLDDKVAMPLPEPASLDPWLRQAEESSLAVALGQSGLELARREVARQRGGHHPTLDLAATYSDNRNVGSGATTIDSRSGVLGLEFGWVLFQGGGLSAAVREAVANQEKARHDLEEARRQARLDARQGFLGVLSGDAQVKALEQALVSSEAQLKSTKLGLEVGVRTRVDVLNAQQQVFTTRRDLAAARYQTLLAGLQLKAAAGSLDAEDLKAVDALLREPAAP